MVVAGGALAVAAASGFGQTGDTTPVIVTQGRGEVMVVPDRGELILTVETRAVDAVRASQQNATIARAVVDTLRRGFSLSQADVTTAGYNLHPQMVYPGDGKPPQVTGYVVTNSVRVRVAQLERMGSMIDAGIRKGATGVGSIAFYSSHEADARRAALTSAVQAARRDAEAMAAAAGGALGGLLEITTESVDVPRPVTMMMRAQAVAETTPIQPGEERVTAFVRVRWRFVSR
jgi:uncharacterized protein YggE